MDKKFIQALREAMPPAVGVALGVDRLVMILCGAKRVADVVAFTAEEV